jgi:hypothetical protein
MLIHEFSHPLITTEGIYRVQVLGQQNGDMWSGWIAFRPERGGVGLWTEQETLQPSLSALQYWATGLEPVYLEGALVRAQDHAAVR